MIIPFILVIDRALRDAGIPIESVSIGDPAIRATWAAQYLPTATPAQKTQGDQIVATFDPQDPATVASIKADLSTGRASEELIRAVVQGLYGAIPSPTRTLVQVRNDILAIYRNLL